MKANLVKMSTTDHATVGDDPENRTVAPIDPQETAFLQLYDYSTGRLRIPIGDPAAKAAIRDLSSSAASTMHRLDGANKFSSGLILCHGACLLAGLFHCYGVLVPAWTGPSCDLKESAALTLKNFNSSNSEV